MSSSTRIGPVAQAWYKWKALRLPWRNRFFIGYDLQGNTFWEFRLTRQDQRWRRIVTYPRSAHLSSVKVSPLWHQWLRHTREQPPSLEEQQGDIVRQAKMKYLAAAADARWEAKPRVMEDPLPPTQHRLPAAEDEPVAAPTRQNKPAPKKPVVEEKDPWAAAKARGPSEDWQPAAWTPGTVARK